MVLRWCPQHDHNLVNETSKSRNKKSKVKRLIEKNTQDIYLLVTVYFSHRSETEICRIYLPITLLMKWLP